MVPSPGEIYFADLGGPVRRRAIVVSRELLNRGDYVMVVPVTEKRFAERSRLENCVPFRRGQFGFTADCVAQAENATRLLKGFLDLEAGAVGRIDGEKLRDLIRAIGYVIEADCEPS